MAIGPGRSVDAEAGAPSIGRHRAGSHWRENSSGSTRLIVRSRSPKRQPSNARRCLPTWSFRNGRGLAAKPSRPGVTRCPKSSRQIGRPAGDLSVSFSGDQRGIGKARRAIRTRAMGRRATRRGGRTRAASRTRPGSHFPVGDRGPSGVGGLAQRPGGPAGSAGVGTLEGIGRTRRAGRRGSAESPGPSRRPGRRRRPAGSSSAPVWLGDIIDDPRSDIAVGGRYRAVRSSARCRGRESRRRCRTGRTRPPRPPRRRATAS